MGHFQKTLTIIRLAEENKYLVLDDDKPQSETQAEPPAANVNTPALESPQIKPDDTLSHTALRSRKPVWIIGSVAAIAALLLLFPVFRKPTEVVLADSLLCSFTGVNGAGSAELTAADTSPQAFQELLNDTKCSFTDTDGNSVENGTLANGNSIVYACAFDEQALKQARLTVTDPSVSLTVEGLPEPEPIDLFEDVYLYSEIDEESGVIYLYAAPRDSKFREVYYKVVSEEANEIVIYADISDELLLTYGLVAEDHYHTYGQEVLPEEIKELYHKQLINRSKENAASYRDEYGREIANGSDTSINELAQSFIGRTGACNEIANSFIYSLYGVQVHTGYSLDHLYPVDTPEPGDLIYYYDAAGNYRHVATYIGNGLVLNGNYGDGTAHITSMYESWYAENPMTYLRVQR